MYNIRTDGGGSREMSGGKYMGRGKEWVTGYWVGWRGLEFCFQCPLHVLRFNPI